MNNHPLYLTEFLKEHKLIPSEADWETNGTCRD